MEEHQQRLQEAEGRVETEVKEAGLEDRRGEEAAAVATTAVELTNSTAPTGEAGGSGEGPGSDAPPARTAPIEKPLEHMMRDMG